MWATRQRTARVAAVLLIGAAGGLVAASSPAAAAVPGGMVQAVGTSATDSVQSKSAVAVCPAGTNVIGTGSSILGGGADVSVEAVVPDVGLTSVTVTAKETDPSAALWSVAAFAQCAPPLPGQVRVMVTNLASSSATQMVIASCPAGLNATGVGYDVDGGFGEVIVNRVVPNGGALVPATQAAVTAYEDGLYLPTWSLTGYLICADPIPGQQVVTASTAVSFADPQTINVTCPAGQDLTSGGIAAVTTALADASELGVNSALPVPVGGRINTSVAIAFVEDPIPGTWNLTSYGICT